MQKHFLQKGVIMTLAARKKLTVYPIKTVRREARKNYMLRISMKVQLSTLAVNF